MRDVLGTIQADQDAIIRAGSRGALVVDGGPGTGKTVVALHRTAYLLYSDPRLGHRRGGVLFVGPGEDVYEGMIIGENSRPDDMMVNCVREKQKTNIRTHSADEAIKLTPPKIVTLESGIEFIAEDELVEVTPESIRVRKRILKEQDRRRLKR